MSCFFQVSKQKLKDKVKGALWKSAAKLMKAKVLKAKKAKNDEKKKEIEEGGAIVAEVPLPVDWPKGCKVRVVDEGMQKVYFGVQATVEGAVKGGLSLMSVFGKVVQCMPGQIQKEEGLLKALPMRPLRELNKVLKQDFLLEAGYGQEEESDFEEFKAEIFQKGPFRLWNGHVAMLSRHLLWGLQVDETQVQVANPLLVQAWLEGTAGEGDLSNLATHRAALQAMCRKALLVLVPIWDQNGKGSGGAHWTLLAIDRRMKEIRYYDTLLHEAAGNRASACQVWSMLREFQDDMPVDVPAKRNKVVQEALQCGLFVIWYVEEEIRHFQGQGWASQGWPSAEKVTARLKQLLRQVEAEERLMRDAIKAQADLPPLPPPAGPPPVIQEHLEALAATAKESMDKGQADVGGPVPVEDDDLEAWAAGMVEWLTPGHQEICRKVQLTGIGICAKCRWKSGCYNCSFAKAVRYWRDQEAHGEFGEGYHGRGKGRGKGKGRGRSRGRAGEYKGGGVWQGDLEVVQKKKKHL
jgi:hypothetical protein